MHTCTHTHTHTGYNFIAIIYCVSSFKSGKMVTSTSKSHIIILIRLHNMESNYKRVCELNVQNTR